MQLPAHKHVGDAGKPGQLVNDVTLGDYLARKRRYEALDIIALENVNKVKKLTFDDWYPTHKHLVSYNYEQAQLIWKAAQENV